MATSKEPKKEMTFEEANMLAKIDFEVNGINFREKQAWKILPEAEALAKKCEEAEKAFGCLVYDVSNLCDSCTRRDECNVRTNIYDNVICKFCSFHDLDTSIVYPPEVLDEDTAEDEQ